MKNIGCGRPSDVRKQSQKAFRNRYFPKLLHHLVSQGPSRGTSVVFKVSYGSLSNDDCVGIWKFPETIASNGGQFVTDNIRVPIDDSKH